MCGQGPEQPGSPGVGVLALEPRTLTQALRYSCTASAHRLSEAHRSRADQRLRTLPPPEEGQARSQDSLWKLGEGEAPEDPSSQGCRLPGASWRVWQGSLWDDSRGREFPNDWEYFYFWACAQFPTESLASS